jgi:elongation factor Ts
VAKTPDFQALVRDIAMHIAGTPYTPLYVAKDEVPAEVLDKEKEIYREQARAAGKPAAVVDKIAEGKLKDYYSSFVLLEQPYIRDDKKTVGQLIQEKIALIKENIVVRRFARFKVGEVAAAPAAGDAEAAPVAS